MDERACILTDSDYRELRAMLRAELGQLRRTEKRLRLEGEAASLDRWRRILHAACVVTRLEQKLASIAGTP